MTNDLIIETGPGEAIAADLESGKAMADDLIVETAYGAVGGERGDGVLIWRGIPYAGSTAGEQRFKIPKAAESWKGVRDAAAFGPACPQDIRNKGRAEVGLMSEDCLSLNIWSPAADRQKRAVLFYIHGGSFAEGAGGDPEYEGTSLVRAGDIVLVTVNYRLGALGFVDFSFLGEGLLPNTGLWDIIAALNWVNENIGAFGGDPDNVTICGQSAGATCACILPGIDEAEGLFKRAIMMSAVPTLLHTKEQARYVAQSFLKFMDIPDAETLMTMPARELTARQNEFTQHSGFGTTAFAPCVDGEFVKRYPTCLAADGGMRGIPMLLGTTREEMTFALYRSLAHLVDIQNMRRLAMETERLETKERIDKAYQIYGKRGPGIMFSDFAFRLPCVWLAEAQSRFADTWMYRFDYETLGMRVSGLHAFHSCDVPFLFGNFKAGLARFMFLLSPEKTWIRKLQDEFRGDFLAFMKTGKLPWRPCKGEDGPAKCYTHPSFVEQAVPKDILKAYEDSEFKKSSFTDEGMAIPLNDSSMQC